MTTSREVGRVTHEEQLRAALAELEHAPDIAAYLHQLGLRGTRKHPEGCVLYRFFAASGCNVLMVGHIRISYPNPNRHPADMRTYLTVATPPRVADFLREFDEGHHPRLEDPTFPCWTPRGP